MKDNKLYLPSVSVNTEVQCVNYSHAMQKITWALIQYKDVLPVQEIPL